MIFVMVRGGLPVVQIALCNWRRYLGVFAAVGSGNTARTFSSNRKLHGQAEWNGPLYELKNIEFTFCEDLVNL
jgi:hypothetical protein